jgi:AAA domain/CHC2 zinc finger
MTNDFQQLKQSVGRKPFEQRLRLNSGFAACPFHNGSSDKSMHLHREPDGVWVATCFSDCAKTWNPIDFVMQYDRVPFAEAVKRLGGNVWDSDTQEQHERPEAEPKQPPMTRQEYATWGREITEDDAARLAAGRPHSETPGFKTLKMFGCRVSGDYIGFPFHRPGGGELYTLKKRHLDIKDLPQERSVSQKGFFNLETANAIEDLYVVEGELDALVMEEAGFRAVSVTTGKQKEFERDALDKIGEASRIFLIGDQEVIDHETGQIQADPGPRCMDALQLALIAARVPKGKIFRIRFAEKKDVGEAALLDIPLQDQINEWTKAAANRKLSWVSLYIPTVSSLSKEPQKWLIDRMLPYGGLTILCGKQGAQKSFFGLFAAKELTRSISHKFLGRNVNTPTEFGMPVLYLDRENPESLISERRQSVGIIKSDRLHYWGDWRAERPPEPDDPRLLEFAASGGYIIFDSLQDWYGQRKEIDNTQMVELMTMFKRLAHHGPGVLILHHDSKFGEEGYRGATSIIGLTDHAMKASKRSSKNEDGSDTIELREVRFRMCGSWELDYKMAWNADGHGNYGFWPVRDEGTQQAVARVVADKQKKAADKEADRSEKIAKLEPLIEADPNVSLRKLADDTCIDRDSIQALLSDKWKFDKTGKPRWTLLTALVSAGDGSLDL